MRRIAVTLALVGTVSLTAAPQDVRKQDFPCFRILRRVESTIACGGATTPEALAELKMAGFVSVVNLRLTEEEGARIPEAQAAADKAGVRYFHLPFRTSSPDPDLVDRFIATVNEPKNQPVFIHCGSANRVAALWMIKRVKVDKWPVERALEEATAIGLTSEALKEFALGYLKQGVRH
jgi:uncharacterized protein (TIGR01244 family)